MAVTAEAPAEPEVIPLDQLTRRMEAAIGRLQPPDLRPRLLARLRSGPEYPVDSAATELSRDSAVTFVRQVVMSTGPDELCAYDRSQYATCPADDCRTCQARAAVHADLLDLIAHELDEMEAQLTAEAAGVHYEENCHPAEGAWWAYCGHCGTRFQTRYSQTQFCGATCRKAAQRARDRAQGIVRP